jgi:predicted acyl esterase
MAEWRAMPRTFALAILLALLVPSTAAAAFKAHGSARQVYVTGAKPGTKVTVGGVTKRAGRLGGIVFRGVKPGTYRVRGKQVRVFSDRSAPPSKKSFKQKLPKNGYGYLTTRDGTKLAIAVRLPSGPGPYPTLIEYSGYGYANPEGAQSGISPIANLLGYAVVDVNMRGTGCSGGAFDYFERLQSLDGYDIVETVSRQPWVARHKVGMLGVSYGGISQLFVAQTRPPSLAAITPLSVVSDTQTTLYPGGILNTGFTLAWAKERAHDALPASKTGGEPWALKRIQGGDKTCKANQALHTEAVDTVAKVRRNNYYVPKVADPLAPNKFVQKINVPTFLACQFTDEQTGGHCASLPKHFTGTKRKWFTFTNGNHIDSLDPATFTRWYDFLELYVAHRRPHLPDGVRAAAPVVFKSAMGVDGVTLPDDPIQAQPTYEAALAAFQAQPPVRILFDNGAGSTPFSPVAGFERSFSRFPLPGTTARSWYLAAGGALADAKPGAAGSDTFKWSRAARPATSFTGNTGSGTNGLWTATPSYRWTQNPPGTAASYVSAPLGADTAVVGAGALEAWIKSPARSVDLQATVTEVRPDGLETYVQSGWLRTSVRKLDKKHSTPLEPVLSLRKKDAARLPKGKFAKVTVPLYYQGHVYRAGSRVRVTLSAPRGDQPVWAFAERQPRADTNVIVARDPKRPSRLLLPVVPGITAPTPLPPCPGLRGEPCRTFVP